MSREITIPVPQRVIDPCLFPPFYETVPLPNGFVRTDVIKAYNTALGLAKNTNGNIGTLFSEFLLLPDSLPLILTLIENAKRNEPRVAGELFEQLAALYVKKHFACVFGPEMMLVSPKTTREMYAKLFGVYNHRDPNKPPLVGIDGIPMPDGFIIFKKPNNTLSVLHYVEYTAYQDTKVVLNNRNKRMKIRNHLSKMRLRYEIDAKNKLYASIKIDDEFSLILVVPSNSKLLTVCDARGTIKRIAGIPGRLIDNGTGVKFLPVPITKGDLKSLTIKLMSCQDQPTV